jgi:hypothetical protein
MLKRVPIKKILADPKLRAELLRRACAFLSAIGRHT